MQIDDEKRGLGQWQTKRFKKEEKKERQIYINEYLLSTAKEKAREKEGKKRETNRERERRKRKSERDKEDNEYFNFKIKYSHYTKQLEIEKQSKGIFHIIV